MSVTRLLRVSMLALILAIIGTGALADVKFATDNLKGRGVRGPYLLNFQPVVTNSETILVDGMRQSRTRDYLIDYDTGMLIFEKAVRNGHNISVSYQCDAQAQKRSGLLSPASLNLVSGKKSSLNFTIAQSADGSGSMQLSALGLTSKVEHGGNTFNTMFLVDPSAQNDQGGTDPFSTKSAMKFDSAVGLGGLKISGNFLHVGENFLNAKSFGLQEGVDKTGLAADWKVAKGLQLTASNDRTEALVGQNKGKIDTASKQGLTYEYSKSGQFSALRQENQTQLADGTSSTTLLERLKLTQQFGKGINFTAINERSSAKGTKKDDDISTLSLNLSAQLAPNLNFQTSRISSDSENTGGLVTTNYGISTKLNANTNFGIKFVENNSELQGKDTKASFNLQTKLSMVNLSAAQVNSTSDASGDQKVTDLNVSAGSKPLKASLAMIQTDSEKGEDSQVTKVGLSSEGKAAKVTMGMVRTDAENAGTTMDTNVGMSLNVKAFTLNTGLAMKDSENVGTETKAKVELGTFQNRLKLNANLIQGDYLQQDDIVKTVYGMEVNPWRPLKLTATVSQGETGSKKTQEGFATGMELNPGKRFALQGSFSQEADAEKNLSKVTSIKTDTKPIDGVSFSGLYKNREKTNNDDLSTVVASLSISPVKSLELIGNYETNPEDKNKNVNQITRRLVGVKTSMGSLSLTGKYGSTEDLLSGQLAQTREYGVELKLWSSTKFSAGLTQDDPMIGFTQNTYTMRFERNLGSDFSLSLEGKMIASDSTSQEKDITAGAKLGMKF